MLDQYYNIISSKPVILTLGLMIIFIFILSSIIFSYFIFNCLQISFEYCNVFFYEYNKKCQKMLHKYGDCKINNIYIVRQPLSKFTNFALNLLSFFTYNRYLSESYENYIFHSALIFEINTDDGIRFLLVEKNNCINICETFLIHKTYEFKRINLAKYKTKCSKITLNKILKQTQKRIGEKKYFNWDSHKNNCQEFVKEVLITLNEDTNKYNNFIFRDKNFQKYYSPTDLTIYLINAFMTISNFIEKYIFDNNIFY